MNAKHCSDTPTPSWDLHKFGSIKQPSGSSPGPAGLVKLSTKPNPQVLGKYISYTDKFPNE